MVVVLKKLLEHVLIAKNVRPTPCTFCFVHPHKQRNLKVTMEKKSERKKMIGKRRY